MPGRPQAHAYDDGAPVASVGERRVLWAEDSPEDQILIQAALDGAKAPRIEFVEDGVQMLAAARKARPALVVLDLKMPRMGGLEALRQLRADPALAELRVCVFSAGDQPSEIAACRGLGALDVVAKPVDFRKFSAAVQQILAHA